MTAALDGKVAVVTGCGNRNGIGSATALALADAGADVVVTDLALTHPDGPTAGGIDVLADQIRERGRRAWSIAADVSDEADVERTFAEVLIATGRVDILVNNAAAPHGADRDVFWNVPAAAFDRVVRVDLFGTFLMSKEFARSVLAAEPAGAAIVNVSSIGGKRGFQGRAAYCAAKAAVIRLTESMAQELAPHGIRVNALCPGPIQTDRSSAAGNKKLITGSPLGRMGEPSEAAETILFLASPAASFITGQALSVDGGVLMG